MAELIDAYRDQLLALAPLGPAWPRDEGHWLWAYCHAVAVRLAAYHQRVLDLQREADPRRTLEMLADWERAYGLPDSCGSRAQGVDERRGDLVARLLSRLGQRIASYQQLARALGAGEIKLSRLPPLVSGFQSGQSCAPAAARFAFVVSLPQVVPQRLRAGSGQAGQPIAQVNSGVLECRIRRFAHVESVVFFRYGEQ